MSDHLSSSQPFEREGEEERCSRNVAFLCWLACVCGICGVHRFYLGKPISGLLYLLTFGLLGVGQVIDLFYMREMVLVANQRNPALPAGRRPKLLRAAQSAAGEALRVELLRAAAAHGGKLSVPQGVMATGRTFKEVEAALDEMLKSGYVDIDNDPETGVVVYTVDGLGGVSRHI